MIAAAQETGLTPPLPAPAIGPGIVRDDDPLAGELFLQSEVVHGGIRGRFDDVVARGFVLLSTTGDPAEALDPDLASFFASIGGSTVRVGADALVVDSNGSYAKWLAARNVAVVLQRPDFHIFGAAPAIDGAADLVRGLRAALERV